MIGKCSLLVVIVATMMTMPMIYASTAPCSDGTAYFQCSQTKPGYACLPDSSTGGNSLQNDLSNKLVIDYKTKKHKCACSNFAGYVELNGECVKTTCTYNGAQVNDGQCASDKPKRCVQGQMVDDSNACGCPVGQQMKADKVGCEKKSGCRWGTITCSPEKECKYDEATPQDDGTCTPKQGCVYGTVKCNSFQKCDTSTNPNGVCVTKSGCQYLNPACSKGETCNPVSGKCEIGSSVDSALTILGDGSANQNTANATTATGTSSPTCCCLPAVGGIGLVGYAIYRKAKDEE